ncbi:MAG: hypothetical protein V1660_00335 [archaeon]
MAKKNVLDLNKKVKNLDILDMGLTKLAVFCFALALITLFPAFLLFVLGINPWVYVALFVVAAIRPLIRMFK